jgi:hypothetical protein
MRPEFWTARLVRDATIGAGSHRLPNGELDDDDEDDVPRGASV